MKEFTFKRAPVRSSETWTLSGETLSRKEKSISLLEVSEVMFEQAAGPKALWVTALKLASPNKTLVHLQCNDRFAGPQRQQFVALCLSVVTQLVSSGSTASVRQGMGTRILAWVMALGGLAFILFGGFMMYLGAAENDGVTPFIFGGIAILSGIFMIAIGAPWQTQPERDLAGLHEELQGLIALMDKAS